MDPEQQSCHSSLWRRFFSFRGINKAAKLSGGESFSAPAACTGALYHIDLYVVCGDLEDLDAGVYQFSPQDFALRKLRAGDYRSVLVAATGEEPAIVAAPCVIVSASTFWRNAWKYQSRAYRHCYWDNGTVLANLLAAAVARNVPAKVVLGFVDVAVGELLALDSQREAPLSLVALGHSSTRRIGLSPPIAPLVLETTPLSKTEVDYPAMRAMHEASSLASAEEVKTWRETKAEGGRIKDEGKTRLFRFNRSLEKIPQATTSTKCVGRSKREFAANPFSSRAFEQLDRATRGIEADL